MSKAHPTVHIQHFVIYKKQKIHHLLKHNHSNQDVMVHCLLTTQKNTSTSLIGSCKHKTKNKPKKIFVVIANTQNFNEHHTTLSFSLPTNTFQSHLPHNTHNNYKHNTLK
jgi:hypothetical protein